MITDDLQVLGDGSFAVVFQLENGRVLIRSNDRMKLHMSTEQFPKHRMFPTLNFIENSDYFEDGEFIGKYNYFESDEYLMLRDVDLKETLSKRQYRFYRCLNRYFNYGCIGKQAIINTLGRFPKYLSREAQVLKDAVLSFTHLTDNQVCLEAQNFNLAVDGDKLIMLDIFFPSNRLQLK